MWWLNKTETIWRGRTSPGDGGRFQLKRSNEARDINSVRLTAVSHSLALLCRTARAELTYQRYLNCIPLGVAPWRTCETHPKPITPSHMFLFLNPTTLRCVYCVWCSLTDRKTGSSFIIKVYLHSMHCCCIVTSRVAFMRARVHIASFLSACIYFQSLPTRRRGCMQALRQITAPSVFFREFCFFFVCEAGGPKEDPLRYRAQQTPFVDYFIWTQSCRGLRHRRPVKQPPRGPPLLSAGPHTPPDLRTVRVYMMLVDRAEEVRLTLPCHTLHREEPLPLGGHWTPW